MIIVEGPDGAGKSTLIKKLSEWTRMPIAPKVVDNNTNPMTDLRTWVDAQLEEDKTRWDVLFDRHRLISEPIYSLAIGGDREEKFWELDWLKEAMNKFYDRQPFVIWCMTDYHTIAVNCEDDSNQFIRPFLPKIYRGYIAEMARWSAMIGSPFQLTYDYTVGPVDGWREQFDEMLTFWKDR